MCLGVLQGSFEAAGCTGLVVSGICSSSVGHVRVDRTVNRSRRGGTFFAEVEGTRALTSWFPAMKHHRGMVVANRSALPRAGPVICQAGLVVCQAPCELDGLHNGLMALSGPSHLAQRHHFQLDDIYLRS